MNLGLVCLNFGICLTIVLGALVAPRGKELQVITSPFVSEADRLSIISAANGSYVSAGRYDWITIAYSDDPGFPLRLLKAGALLVLNNDAEVGCGRKLQ
ncbi:hypothetical protein QA648_34640 (plasmid) [Rhizobium sp. CB3171]|uniref:hypothetical protein n=1 Tax=Rhizobium sp. CB3171 TaxID=3039157 RepID=UPI0024B1F3B1|nr:hypothetical protein [Rhizobium sp. CB3171]WFU07230.1 hypothetical protein QA648_34640 [Rhizobium sp. CB3171]